MKECIKKGDYISAEYDTEYYMIGKCTKVEENKIWADWASKKLKSIPNKKELNCLVFDDNGFMYAEDVTKIKDREPRTIKHVITNNKTIVLIYSEDGTYSKGESSCHPEDDFSEYYGFCVAYGRALYEDNSLTFNDLKAIEDFTDEELIEELKRRMAR